MIAKMLQRIPGIVLAVAVLLPCAVAEAGMPAGAEPAAPAATKVAAEPAAANAAAAKAAGEAVAAKAESEEPPWPKESVEADVATRSVAITSGFSGSQVVVFGTVENSRQETAEAGLYDVVIVIEGKGEPTTVRKKSRVAGIWVNTDALKFDSVPGYYAITATRPLDEIADKSIFLQYGIGFDHVAMVPTPGEAKLLPADTIEKYREAVVELKQRKKLYFEQDYGVTFIGKSLFRSTITLPGNVPVGPLTARVYLLREGQMLASFAAHVTLKREGVERALYDFAHGKPVLYGLSAIFVAVAAGLAASVLFNRSRA